MTDSNRSTEHRMRSLQDAAEIFQKITAEVKQSDGEDSSPYRASAGMACMFTQIFEHADEMPAQVLAWCIATCEAIVEMHADDMTDQALAEALG